MSDGLNLISAALAAGSVGTILGLNQTLFVEQEIEAFDFVRQHYRQYRELPEAATVRTETGIALPAARENLAYYVNAVHDRKSYTEIRDRIGVLRDNMRDMDVPEMRRTIAEMNQAVRAHDNRREVHTLGEGLQMVQDRLIATRGLGGITGVETGWPRYDMMTGGYQNSDIITFVGRMGTGKTYVLLRQAERAWVAGRSVLVVTTEMGTEQISRRMVSLSLGIDPTKLKLNMISTHQDRRIQQFITSSIATDRFHIFSIGMGAKINALEALLQEYQPDIVFIDGVYLIHPSVKQAMKRIERVGEVFDELKSLNISADRPFVVSTQFNRQAGKDGKDGSLETIGFSDAIGTHSSIVVGIKNGPTENPKQSRTLDFMKGREGESGELPIHFRFAPVNFDEFTEAEEAHQVTEGPDVEWMAAGTAPGVERRTRRDRRSTDEV